MWSQDSSVITLMWPMAVASPQGEHRAVLKSRITKHRRGRDAARRGKVVKTASVFILTIYILLFESPRIGGSSGCIVQRQNLGLSA